MNIHGLYYYYDKENMDDYTLGGLSDFAIANEGGFPSVLQEGTTIPYFKGSYRMG